MDFAERELTIKSFEAMSPPANNEKLRPISHEPGLLVLGISGALPTTGLFTSTAREMGDAASCSRAWTAAHSVLGGRSCFFQDRVAVHPISGVLSELAEGKRAVQEAACLDRFELHRFRWQLPLHIRESGCVDEHRAMLVHLDRYQRIGRRRQMYSRIRFRRAAKRRPRVLLGLREAWILLSSM